MLSKKTNHHQILKSMEGLKVPLLYTGKVLLILNQVTHLDLNLGLLDWD